MMRYAGLTLLACSILCGCASSERPVRSMIGVKMPNFKASGDPDIVATSLRPLPKKHRPSLPKKRLTRPDLGVNLKNTRARLQLRFPLLPRRFPMQLTATLRGYWSLQSIASPLGRILLRLRVTLPFKQSWVERKPSPPKDEDTGEQPEEMETTNACTNDALDPLARSHNHRPCHRPIPRPYIVGDGVVDLDPSALAGD